MDEDEKDPYKNNFPVFVAFLEMLQSFQDDGDLYALLFKKCKLVQLLSPLLLDSDKLDTGLAKNKNDKLNIMQKLFQFIVHVTSEDSFEEIYARKILKYIFKQPGLMANVVFNLDSPRDDDPIVL